MRSKSRLIKIAIMMTMAMILFVQGVSAQAEKEDTTTTTTISSDQATTSCVVKEDGTMVCDMKPADKSKSEGKAQTICPIMGREINKDKYVDYNGKRIYLCCNACIKIFNKDPEKIMKKFKEDGIELEDSPK